MTTADGSTVNAADRSTVNAADGSAVKKVYNSNSNILFNKLPAEKSSLVHGKKWEWQDVKILGADTITICKCSSAVRPNPPKS